MIDFAKLLADHGLTSKIDFLHTLADHLRELAADPAGVQSLAGRIKTMAHALETKLADKIDPIGAKPVTAQNTGQPAASAVQESAAFTKPEQAPEANAATSAPQADAK